MTLPEDLKFKYFLYNFDFRSIKFAFLQDITINLKNWPKVVVPLVLI